MVSIPSGERTVRGVFLGAAQLNRVGHHDMPGYKNAGRVSPNILPNVAGDSSPPSVYKKCRNAYCNTPIFQWVSPEHKGTARKPLMR